MISFRFAFQGGGANFITLLAAAKAVHDIMDDHKDTIRLDKLAGTSAGSIVASILAIKTDPELIRDHLADHGKSALEDIIVMPAKDDDWRIVKIGKWGVKILSMIGGHPFFEFEKLEEFINGLHNRDKIRKDFKLSEVSVPLILTNSDLSEGGVVYWRSCEESNKHSRDQIYLARAVANSCAIPLIFKSFNGTLGIQFVDGGLVENFPLEKLTDGFPANRVIGFSFEKSSERNINTPKKYLGSVLSAMINSNIDSSSRFIPADNIIKLPCRFETLDFDAALTDGLQDFYDSVRMATYSKLEDIISREKDQEYSKKTQSKFSKTFNVKKSAASIFDKYRTKEPRIVLAEFEWTLFSLLSSLDRRSVDYNESWRSYTIQRPQGSDSLVMRINLCSLTDKIDLTLNEVFVFDDQGRAIPYDPLIGEIEVFGDDFLIPVFLFIDLRGTAEEVANITISHLDQSRDHLPKFMMSSRNSGKDEEPVAVFCSYPGFERVICSVHIPDQVYERCDFVPLIGLEEEYEARRIISGEITNNYHGGSSTPQGFRTVRWCSTEEVYEGDIAGFSIKERVSP
ncbi:patatin-like phospholipase family protein [uncultured Marivita sp.]|uniref:patatin-like phospholipase family protein n=1 Tax=uncultured Marivita sp. TaxID=888080 RepID=UPI002631A2F3|nr:patatin-like phospholipase family protein [uncultured Marivita sp.]